MVFERNRADDTFGWGVVLSDEALGNLAANDPVSAASIRENFAYWDDVAVEFKGERIVSGGHGFCGIGRMKLLLLLQARARELGVELRFQNDIADEQIEALSRDYDLVVSSDGLNSRTRTLYADHFRPDVDVRKCKFVWLGTRQKFHDAFTFIFKETEKGWLWAHAYQFDADTATFIVECSEDTWNAYGFGAMSQEESIATCEAIFADELGGHPLISNASHIRGSAWISFPRVLCENWSYKNVVLMGDAAATAHFSIGSGTRLALDSAIALATYLHTEPTLEAAFAQYQDARRLDVLRLQSAARNSMEWFEEIERYFHLDPVQFTYSLLTRSQRISHENLRLRDEDWLNGAEALVPAPRRRRLERPGPPPDVRPLPPARHRAQEPHRRLADGPVQGRRRRPDRLAPRPPRRARQGRRRPRLHRDDLRHPRGPHLPRLPRHLQRARPRPPGSASSTSSTPRPTPRSASSSATPAPRARPSSAGSRTTARSPPATGRSSRSPRCPGRRRTRPRRRWTAPTWTASATPSSRAPGWASAAASTCSSCTWRTATCSRPSSRR